MQSNDLKGTNILVFTKIRKLRTKKFYNIGPRTNIVVIASLSVTFAVALGPILQNFLQLFSRHYKLAFMAGLCSIGPRPMFQNFLRP
jgi:hypothetical protein